MTQSKTASTKGLRLSLFTAICLLLSLTLVAQDITTYQYRQVSPDKTGEFIKRETTYWSKVARKAIDKGTLTFWALLERVDGADVQNAPNFLFINTYTNVDGNMGSLWDPTTLFPKIPVSQISTNAISKVTGEYFLQSQGWQQSGKAVPDKDFQYIIMVYHNSSNPGNFIEMENRHWSPFIKAAMDNSETKQMAWGNAAVLSPSGPDVKFNSVSYDLFPTLQSALMQAWSPNTKFPTAGLDSLAKIASSMPAREIYRIVKVEAKQ
jgi:hypothetical protein